MAAVTVAHSIQLTPFVSFVSTGEIAYASCTCDQQCEIFTRATASVVELECMHMYAVRLRILNVLLHYWVLGLGLALRKQNAYGRTRE